MTVTDGYAPVPPEATAHPTGLRYGTITVRGIRDGVQRISIDLPYLVMHHASVPGSASGADPPAWWSALTLRMLPPGGKAGQVLAKTQDDDYAAAWIDRAGGGGYRIGDGLRLDIATNTLAVDTADKVEDNTRPISAAAVYMEIGNIEALMKII